MATQTVRVLGPDEHAVIELVAQRMGQTLVEVLGAERGGQMYSQPWLVERVRWHLDEERAARVFVAEVDGGVVGHTIVRVEEDGTGLFSTTYVAPEARRQGLADRLLDAGEAWLLAQGVRRLATNTDADNTPLIELYRRRGYRVSLRDTDAKMIQLAREPADG